MAIESVSSKISYTITGGQSTFAYPYKFFTASDLNVYVETNGVQTLLTYGSGFTFEEVLPEYPNGVNIILSTAYPDGSTLVINRNLALIQPMRLPTSGTIDTEALEEQLDKLVMMIQQLNEQVGRSVKTDITSTDLVSAEAVLAELLSVQSQISALYAASQAAVNARDAALLAQAAAEQAAEEASAVSGVPLKANGAEVAAGTDDDKYMTPKSLADAVTNEGLEFPEIHSGTLNLGDGTDKTLEIVAKNADANKPKIRYNHSTNAWEFSNDGTNFNGIPASNGANVGCVALTTSAGVYVANPSPAFGFANLSYINVVPDTAGLTQINLNSAGAKTIYSHLPLQANVQYELIYLTGGDCFLANRVDSVTAPADSNDYRCGWRVYGSAIRAVVDGNRASAAWSTFGVVTAINNPWNVVGGGTNLVLLPNGKVLCVPYASSSTSAKIFDPATNTFASSGSFAVGGYISGVQLPSGLTMMIPYAHAANKKIQLYNSTAGEIQGIPADSWGALDSVIGATNIGGVVLDNGLVLITPAYTGTDCYLVDPVNDAVGNVIGNMDANVLKSPPIIAPNGMVYIFTAADYYYCYNPDRNTLTKQRLYTAISGNGSLSFTHRGGIWIGKKLATGSDGIFDPEAMAMAYLGAVNTLTETTTACLLPDGRIYMCGKTAGARIYDPIANSVITPASSPALDSYPTNIPSLGRHALLMPNGKLLVSTYNNASWYVISNAISQTNFSLGILASKIMNRR